MHCAVLVLGDLGRSPRMQYHTRSLLGEGWRVTLVGYRESPLVEELQRHAFLSVAPIAVFPIANLPRILMLPLKALWLTTMLLWTLLTMPWAKFILVQNPPSIPTLAVAWLACRLRGSKLVIDWHNFGWSILALAVRNQAVVSLARVYERAFGRLADAHFCVSESMRSELIGANWAIPPPISVLHDCPPEFFRQASPQEKQDLLAREPLKSFGIAKDAVICVTATSFTSDEKLGMLLDAIVALDAKLATKASPRLAFIVTGKGDGRVQFEAAAAALTLRRCSIHVTYFDSFRDYALMLGSADVGLSFHASSSGFDLPMKIVDMFGCGLFVCSIRYACIEELVKNDENGLIFDNAEQLADQLKKLFGNPDDSKLAQRLKKGVKMMSWDENWKPQCLPVLSGL